MPELPEVETIRRQLERALTGVRVRAVRVFYPKVIKPLKPDVFSRLVRGARFVSFGRRAKVLIANLSNERTLLIHLKLTGRLLLEKMGAKPRKETETVFFLADGRQLFYDDFRRFGWIKVLSTSEIPSYFESGGYGPEPLERSFTPRILASCLRKHPGKKIKPLLMDQTCVAGIGNIYADESLWDAGILPTRKVEGMSDRDIARLHRAIQKALQLAVRSRGSSANDYLDLFGREGDFYSRLHAYGKEGTRCAKRDSGIIQKKKLAGRGTHWCPKHQK